MHGSGRLSMMRKGEDHQLAMEKLLPAGDMHGKGICKKENPAFDGFKGRMIAVYRGILDGRQGAGEPYALVAAAAGQANKR